MRIALEQVACHLGDKGKNLDSMEKRVGETEADLHVFAETFLTGYMVRDRFFTLAETLEGESVERAASMAEEHGCAILFGAPLWDDRLEGVLRNSAVMVTPGGRVQRYDKLFLANFGPFEERLFFEQGGWPSIFELGGFRLGICICYDLFFPELAKHYAMSGADALICISAGPNTSRPLFESIIPARAVENTMYSVYVNQVGTQLNQVFHGGSRAYSPTGAELATLSYMAEDTGLISLSREDLRFSRRMRPTLRNTQASSWCAGFWSLLAGQGSR